MSTGTSTEGGASEHECGTCGESFDSPQALGGHLSSHSKDEGEPSPAEVADFSDEACQSIIDRLDYNGKDSDSLQTVAAKALINEKGGGSEDFSEVFDPCDDPQCNWGSNGFEADYCVRHQDSESPDEEDSSGSDSRSESEDGGSQQQGEAVFDRFETGLDLTEAGFSKAEAKEILDIVEDNL